MIIQTKFGYLELNDYSKVICKRSCIELDLCLFSYDEVIKVIGVFGIDDTRFYGHKVTEYVLYENGRANFVKYPLDDDIQENPVDKLNFYNQYIMVMPIDCCCTSDEYRERIIFQIDPSENALRFSIYP